MAKMAKMMLATRNPVVGEFMRALLLARFNLSVRKYDCSGELLNSGMPRRSTSCRRDDNRSLRDRATTPAQRRGLYQDAKDREANKHDGRS
jgi:hypothetical protein